MVPVILAGVAAFFGYRAYVSAQEKKAKVFLPVQVPVPYSGFADSGPVVTVPVAGGFAPEEVPLMPPPPQPVLAAIKAGTRELPAITPRVLVPLAPVPVVQGFAEPHLETARVPPHVAVPVPPPPTPILQSIQSGVKELVPIAQRTLSNIPFLTKK